jgi:hypothetical protein
MMKRHHRRRRHLHLLRGLLGQGWAGRSLSGGNNNNNNSRTINTHHRSRDTPRNNNRVGRDRPPLTRVSSRKQPGGDCF